MQPEPFPAKYLPEPHLIDALGRFLDGVFEHGGRVAELFRFLRIMQLDGRDEAVAEELRITALEDHGQSRIAELVEHALDDDQRGEEAEETGDDQADAESVQAGAAPQ